MAEDRTVRKLRSKLETALAKRRDEQAIGLLEKLIQVDPRTPRWPHKLGDLLRRQERKEEAIAAYSMAVDLYADQGFIARAVAMAKTVLNYDPERTEILERVDPEAARRLHRKARPQSAPIAGHPAVIDDASAPRTEARQGGRAHPAVIPDSVAPEPAPRRHPAVIPDSAPAPAPAPRTHPAVIPDSEPAPSPIPRAHPAVIPDSAVPIASSQIEAPATVPKPPKVPDQIDVSAGAQQAEVLTIAPDISPHETRFSNAPPARAFELDVTDLEFEHRGQAPPITSLAPPPDAISLSKLPLFPLFAELPKAAMAEFVRGSDVVEIGDGEFVIRKGDPADSLFGIVEGSVEVVVPGQGMTLAEGDVFGESCLLPGEHRHSDCIARGHLLALRIPRSTLNSLINSYPPLAEILLELLTRRMLGNLLVSSPMFLEFDAAGRQELARLFEIRRAPKGTMLAERGKVMDGLYINLTGELEVSYGDDRPPERYSAGTMCGQASLLTHEPSQITVRADSHMIVLRLPTQAFHRIAMQHPAMLATVSELAPVARVST